VLAVIRESKNFYFLLRASYGHNYRKTCTSVVYIKKAIPVYEFIYKIFHALDCGMKGTNYRDYGYIAVRHNFQNWCISLANLNLLGALYYRI
jgi:hypothetical protein